jgi:hypothetical protein
MSEEAEDKIVPIADQAKASLESPDCASCAGERQKQDAKSQEEHSRSFLESLRDVIFVFSILIFFSGFVYDFSFLRILGIPPSVITVPVNGTFAHAYTVFVDHPIALILLILVTVGLIVAPLLIRWPSLAISQVVVRATALFTGVLIFPILYALAEDSAHRRVDELRQQSSTLPQSFIILCKAKRAGYSAEFLYAAAHGLVTVLTESSDNIYVFYQVPSQGPGDDERHFGFVYAIKKGDVQVNAAILRGAPVISSDLTPNDNC